MKKITAGTIFLVLFGDAVPVVSAEGAGLGIIIGEPTGISVKKWTSPTRAIDAAAAWSFSENDSLQVHADYLIHDFSMLQPNGLEGRMPVYAGLGLRVKLKEGE